MAVPTDQLVLPPPITRVTQALDTANPDIPGEIKLDAHGKLFKTYMEYNGFAAPLIDAFDTWILRILPAQIAAHELNTPTGIVRFGNVLVESPKILGRDEILTPTRARNEGLTYNGAINADMQLTRKPTLAPRPAGLVGIVPEVRVERLQGPTHIGFLPIMLNSSPCHLRGKTDAERLAMGECLKDPFGYFIVKGSERLIIIQEKLRRHRPFLYAQDTKGKTIIVRMTCGTIKGDSIVTVYKFDKDPVIRLGLRFLGRPQGAKPNTISIFQAFRLLGILTPDSMLQRVTQFTRPEWVQKVWYQLQPSLMHLSLVADDIEDISRMKGIQNLPYETRRTTILRDLTEELFPHMANEPLDRKLDLLAIMTVRMAEYMAGLRKLDDRDSWSNKRLETAARAMAQLFMGLWTKVITEVQDEISRTKTDTLEGVSRLLQARVRTITDEFVSSFNSNNWGVKGSLQKENITEFLKRESLLSVYSHIMRINTPASRKAKQPSLRLVHFTSTGYVCPSETPEGENCGLTKNLASTAFASIERDEVPLWNLIMNRVHDRPNELYRTGLLFNGKFKGWCAGETLRSECIALRREGLIYRDTEIVLPQVRVRDEVQTEGFLYINSDGGLVMRPLLIVENGELVLHRRQREWAAEIKQLLETGQREQAEAKRLWALKWDTLVTHGCAEYIGAFEQEYILLAQSMHDLKMRQNDLLSAQQLLQQAQAEFTRMPTEEVKARVAAAQDALSNIQKRRPYTHCELDPSAILGVAASIIPMPEKQPGPRSTFQCIATHEPVLLADGTWTAIGDLKDGQEVVTVDPVTLQVKTTKIHSHFVRPSKDSGKRMLRISTWKGHSLDVTEDHMFLTPQGWIEARYVAGHSLAMYAEGRISFELVGSISPLPDAVISDFTTEAGTHSFIAGPGFVVHNCSMGKQSLGIYHSNYMNRFDTTVKTLAFPTRPIFEPQMNQLIGLNELPAGRMVTIAIMTYLGFNQEDAFIVKKSSIDLGLFWYMKYTTYKVLIKSTRDFREQLGKPKTRPGEEVGRYDILDDRGLPVPGTRFHQGKALIGKNRTNNTTGEVSNASIYAGVGEEGIIDSVLVSTNTDNYTVVKVKTVTIRKPVVGDKLACYSPDHEVLTWERGWISITDLQMTNHVATLVDGQHLQYETPTALQVYDHDGPMHVVKSNQVDLKVTPNHRMYVKTRYGKEYTIMRADELIDKHVHYKKDAEWNVPEQEFFELPMCILPFQQKHRLFPKRELRMDDWLQFLGIWIAEGCADMARTLICINKPRVQNVIFDVITRMGYKPKPSSEKVYIMNKQLSHYMTKLSVGAIHKRLPGWVWTLNQRQSRILLEAMILGDGCMNGNTPMYSTSSTGLKDDVMRLALHCGWAANAVMKVPEGTTGVINGVPYVTHADNWVLTIIKTQIRPAVNRHIKGQQTVEHYTGKVYCCTVPSGVIYVRRRTGDSIKPVWCGQSRYSQKGTIGLILPDEDMPVNEQGVSPDIIVNPHAIPSRMTIGKLIEIVASKLGALKGERINATAFRDFDVDAMRRGLKQYGYNEWGYETYYSGITGKPIQAQIFSGPCYYQMLRHHVKDKMQARSTGLVKPLQRAPVGGRATEGGSALRIGEMERDSFISHGAAATLQERLCIVADKYKTVFCTTCGTIAISDQIQHLYACRKCNDTAHFKTATIPYAYKLLVHYLAGAGLNMTLKMA